ncbi:MAG: hypothetical protein AB7U52_02625, partial [Candidatus Izemoplasmatales bacterium]
TPISIVHKLNNRKCGWIFYRIFNLSRTISNHYTAALIKSMVQLNCSRRLFLCQFERIIWIMKTYIYILKLIPRLFDDNNWTDSDDLIIEKHFNRIKTDYFNNKIIHVGRTINPANDGFGMVVYYAENDQEAEEYMLLDPAVEAKIMTATYREYKVFYK